jgi:hypothetical protein
VEEAYKHYVRDIVYLLREKAAEVTRGNEAGDRSELNKGRELAFREVLSTMQNQADVFGLDKEELCLDGFDALVGPVAPPKPRPLTSSEEPRE